MNNLSAKQKEVLLTALCLYAERADAKTKTQNTDPALIRKYEMGRDVADELIDLLLEVDPCD